MYFYTKAKQNCSVRATFIGLVGSTSSKASPTILYYMVDNSQEKRMCSAYDCNFHSFSIPIQNRSRGRSTRLNRRGNGGELPIA